jgi:hypothetical protein
MKKFTLLMLIVIATVATARAQIQQGNVLIGANLANFSIGLNDPNVFSMDISPKAAWFIKDGVALGAYANIGVETAKGSTTTWKYGAGALGRYYSGEGMNVIGSSRFFGEANVGIGGVSVSNGGGNTTGLDFGFGPGFSYFVTPSLGLEALLKYNGVLGFGSQAYQNYLQLSFGFQIYLPGKATASKVMKDTK